MEAALGGGHYASDLGEEAGRVPFGELFRPKRFGFQAAHTADAPEMLGEFVDQDGFGVVDGLVFGDEAGFEAVEFGRIFAGHNKVLRVEAVLERVLGGSGLALGGTRPGTELGIGAIDFGAGCGAISFGAIRFGAARFEFATVLDLPCLALGFAALFSGFSGGHEYGDLAFGGSDEHLATSD